MSSKDGPPQGANPDKWPTGYVPFRPPMLCFTTKVYCLHVQSANQIAEEWISFEGDVSWIVQAERVPWRTYGEADFKFRGTVRLHCILPDNDEFDVWFGWIKGWSNITTRSPHLQVRGPDAKLLPGPEGGSLGSGEAWGDFFVWCDST
ncbi:hypothetical protein BDZ90DRAFT_262730 [Jaminaea rosea]|uniref:Uncharacterized protein n=1 Tax=Jaminaea rosea TaxID=1569628 RepID=A0A316UJ23_9BASI|nr:hypothetical protein BDZ90DRAFT_262730 [Jaminaea rosea]PWN24868.1 hypothetical protein BDZ90DRAFT_262730 [Jaminaea rosea]